MGLFEHFPYANFHELNAAWILEKTKTLLTRMDAAEARLTAAEARLTTAEGRLDTIEDEITSIQAEIVSIKSQITSFTARLTTAENDINSLKGRMTAAENDIDSLETRLTTAEANITVAANRIGALENRANAIELEIDGLKTRMTTAEGEIDALEAREAIPAHTSGDVGKVLTATSSGVAWGSVSGGNLPAISSGDAGKVLTVNDTETGAVWANNSASSPVYIDFTDSANLPTPSDYISLIKAGRPAYLRMYRAGVTDCTLAPLTFWEETVNAETGNPSYYILAFFDATGQIAAEVGGAGVASQIGIEQSVSAGTVTATATPI